MRTMCVYCNKTRDAKYDKEKDEIVCVYCRRNIGDSLAPTTVDFLKKNPAEHLTAVDKRADKITFMCDKCKKSASVKVNKNGIFCEECGKPMKLNHYQKQLVMMHKELYWKE